MSRVPLEPGTVAAVVDVPRGPANNKYSAFPPSQPRYRRVRILAATDHKRQRWALVEALENVAHGPSGVYVRDRRYPLSALRENGTWHSTHFNTGDLIWTPSYNLHPETLCEKQDARLAQLDRWRRLVTDHGLDGLADQWTEKIGPLLAELDELRGDACRVRELLEEQEAIAQADRAVAHIHGVAS